jgi:FdhD protein
MSRPGNTSRQPRFIQRSREFQADIASAMTALQVKSSSPKNIPAAIPVWRSVSARRHGSSSRCGLDVAEEMPLAIQYNGFAHAVMMGTPHDLEDFAVGFSVAEGIARGVDDFKEIDARPDGDGMAVAITLAPGALRRYLAGRRMRSLRGHTSCGICGIEDLAQVATLPVPNVGAAPPPEAAAVHAALAQLRGFQPLSARTHGAHAAAWADRTGGLVLVREDVGRHNALDKLVGAGLRGGHLFADGFCLITSRCSYEMVQKAVAAGISALVAISAPTALAIQTARRAGLTLLTLDRSGGFLIYAAPDAAAAPAAGACP